jgi:hypothetical protein
MAATVVDARELRLPAATMLAAGLALPLLPGHPGMPCPLRTLTGVPCPLCGMTTSVEDTVHMRFGAALGANPAGVVLVAFAVVLLLVRRPARIVIPTGARVMLLGGMWVFELHRFGFL